MSIDVDGSHEISEQGLSISDPNGNVKLYITSGAGSPQGNPAPVNSWYFQTDEPKLWRKDTALDSGWVEFVAKVAQSIELETYSNDVTSSTTSDDWVDKLVATSSLKDAGFYLLLHSAQVTNSNNSKEVGYRTQWKPNNDATYITLLETILTISRGEEFQVITGVNIIQLVSADEIDFKSQFGQTDAGGTGRIKNSSVTIIKVEDIT